MFIISKLSTINNDFPHQPLAWFISNIECVYVSELDSETVELKDDRIAAEYFDLMHVGSVGSVVRHRWPGRRITARNLQ